MPQTAGVLSCATDYAVSEIESEREGEGVRGREGKVFSCGGGTGGMRVFLVYCFLW